MPFAPSNIYFRNGQSLRSSSDIYYKVIEEIGTGGNAKAYKVMCTEGAYRGITFALKIQYNLSTERRRERFLDESAFLKQCNHPAILRHYDEGEFYASDSIIYPWIVTSYMPMNLAQCITEKSLDIKQKLEYACQLLSALQFLNEYSTVHRDIKPNNIFINGSQAILGDFGLIKRLNNFSEDTICDKDDVEMMSDTLIMDNSGVKGYIAMPKYYRTPELVNYINNADSLKIESDVFQLGLVFVEMFTGTNPLAPAEITSQVWLNPIGEIVGTEHGGLIFPQLRKMLKIDYKDRPDIEYLLSAFTGIYQTVCGC